jgi:hypothetical protein
MFIELPLTLMQMIVQYILVYYMVNMQGSWVYIVLASWALAVVSCSIAVLVGCLVNEVKDVAELTPLLFIPQMLFAGFYISTSQIPVFLRWAQYLCGLKYSMNLILLTEFNPSNESCAGGARPFCESVLKNNGIQTDKVWLYILILVALFAGFRAIGAFFLVRKSTRFY